MALNAIRICSAAAVLCTAVARAFISPTKTASCVSGLQKWVSPWQHCTVGRAVVSIMPTGRRHSSATDEATTVVAQHGFKSSAAREAAIDEVLEEIRSKAGTPAVLDLLQEAVKYTGRGEIRSEFFKAIFPFPLDDFQLAALEALGSRENAVVSAPTGSGKTVAGELAIYYALAMGLRVYYTTPLKALSNQKYSDFCRQYGVERVGLLTGDTNVNRGAQVTVMTTEVYRNMLYAGDPTDLDEVFAVVFDEFHYMNDPERGTVWEESVILSPRHILFVALSATIANVDQVAGWISEVHGPTRMVVSDFRPVPLKYYFIDSEGLYKLFEDENAGPGALNGLIKRVQTRGMVITKREKIKGGKRPKGPPAPPPPFIESPQPINEFLRRRALRERRLLSDSSSFVRPGARQPDGMRFTAWYRTLVEALRKRDLLPAIVFIFSRAGCDRAAAEIGNTASQLTLVTPREREMIKDRVQAFRRANPQVPLEKDKVRLLLLGLASHHAGLLPVYKSLVEDLFNSNLIKVVFATETLAAGVNMPARATVISTVTKKLGRDVVKLMPSQVLQMAGRAGRRGKDTTGHVVLMRSRSEDALDCFDLLCSPVDSIRSHFRSSYGMVVNILRTRNLESCKVLVERSFGNFIKSYTLEKELEEDKERVQALSIKLDGVDHDELKLYKKLKEKLVKAKRAERNMRREATKLEDKYVSTVLNVVRSGAGLLLRDGRSVALVGEATLPHPLTRASVELTVGLSQNGKLLAVDAGDVRHVDAAPEAGLDVKVAMQVAAVLGEGAKGLVWRPRTLTNGQAVVFEAEPMEPNTEEATGLQEFLRETGSKVPPVKPNEPSADLLKQQALVESLEEQLRSAPGAGTEGGPDALLKILEDLEAAEKRVRKKDRVLRGVQEREWEGFLATADLLEAYGALVENQPTGLGQLVGIVRSENELWTSMVLLSEGLADMEAVDLVGVVSALVNDIQKQDVKVRFAASAEAQAHLARLFPAREELLQAQSERALQFPCPLDPALAGVAQCWLAGFSWRELIDTTSLDQGDVCRHIRKVIDILRQIPVLPKGLVPERLKNTAREAADRMDRFPVADDLSVARPGGRVDDADTATDSADGEGVEGGVVDAAIGAVTAGQGEEENDDEVVEVEVYEVEDAGRARADDAGDSELLDLLYRGMVRGRTAGGIVPVFKKKMVKMTRGELKRRKEQEERQVVAAEVEEEDEEVDDDLDLLGDALDDDDTDDEESIEAFLARMAKEDGGGVVRADIATRPDVVVAESSFSDESSDEDTGTDADLEEDDSVELSGSVDGSGDGGEAEQEAGRDDSEDEEESGGELDWDTDSSEDTDYSYVTGRSRGGASSTSLWRVDRPAIQRLDAAMKEMEEAEQESLDAVLGALIVEGEAEFERKKLKGSEAGG